MDIGVKIQQLEQRLAAVEQEARLSHASIDDTALQVRDGSGSLRALIGLQGDGTVAANVVNGPPPPQPSPPILASVLGGVTASWDGTFVGGAFSPMDFARVEVHAGTTVGFAPDASTLIGTIETVQGATVVVPTQVDVYVRLMARTTSGTAGPPSDAVGPKGPTPVVSTDILDGIVTTVKLADNAVTTAKVAAGAIDTNALKDSAVNAQKIGNAAVTTGKLAAGAVNLNALTPALADTAGQRYVDAMSDPTAWSVLAAGTGAALTFPTVPDAPTGKSAGQATGYIVARGTTQIAYDPDVLYRVSVRVRTTAASTSGTDALYAGVLGIAADGVSMVSTQGTNVFSRAHYVAAVAAPLPSTAGWTVFTGYLRGRSTTGLGSTAPDPRAPGPVHSDVRYISPIVYLNYGSDTSGANSGSGTMQVDAFTIEALKTGVVDGTNLVTGSVSTAALSADSVTATQIAANAVSTSELAANAVTTGKLAAGAVTANEIAANTITSGQLAANSVTATQIVAGAVQTAKLDAGAVNADKIAANAVTTAALNALAVTTDKVAANTITAGMIQAGAVDATALKADAITGKTITGGTITGATIQTATTGARITLNEAAQNKILVYNSAGTTIGELSSNGLSVKGTSGALIHVNPDFVYPRLELYNAAGTSGAAIQMLESSAGSANLQMFSGMFAGSGYTDMVWLFNLFNDNAAIQRSRASGAGSATIGGSLNLTATDAQLRYVNTDAPAQNATLAVNTSALQWNTAAGTQLSVDQSGNLATTGTITSGGRDIGRGWVGGGQRTTNLTSITTSNVVVVSTGSIKFVNGRAYRIEYEGLALSTTASTYAVYVVVEGTTISGTVVRNQIRLPLVNVASVNTDQSFNFIASNTSGADITTPISVLVSVASGTGQISATAAAARCSLNVSDVGLASDWASGGLIT